MRDRFSRGGRQLVVRRRVLVSCEGEKTEFYYFRELHRCQQKFAIEPIPGTGKSPLVTVQRAVKRIKRSRRNAAEGYDEVWCVVDTHGDADSDILRKAWQLAKDNDIRLCESHPCFEVWLLKHFVSHACTASEAKDVHDLLDPYWRAHTNGSPYNKTDDGIFGTVQSLTADAVANARAIHEKVRSGQAMSVDTCWTTVYELVAHLLGMGS